MRREGRSSGVFKASVRVVCACQLVRVHTQVRLSLEERWVDKKIQVNLGVFIGKMGVVHEVVKKRYEIFGNINISDRFRPDTTLKI